MALAGCGGQPAASTPATPGAGDEVAFNANATVEAALTKVAAGGLAPAIATATPTTAEPTPEPSATAAPVFTLISQGPAPDSTAEPQPTGTPLPAGTPLPTGTPVPTATTTPTATPLPTPNADATATSQAEQIAAAVAATMAAAATAQAQQQAQEQALATAIAATLTAQATSTPTVTRTPTPLPTQRPSPTLHPRPTPRPTPRPRSTPTPVAAGARLAYVVGDVGDTDVQVYDPATRSTVAVANRGCDEAEPDWSADGQSVVYQANCDGSYDLYLVEVATRSVRRLTATAGQDEREPDISPDGNWLVYRTNWEPNARNQDGDLFVMNLGGGDPQRLGISGRSPQWSPDGTRILYMYLGDGWEVYVYSLVDRTTQRLTYCEPNCRFPAWSPDGQWVIYHSTTGPTTTDAEYLWRIPAGGGEAVRLVTGMGAGRPTWSADGWIAFNSQRGIEVVDESSKQRHTLLAGDVHWAPAWSR